MFNTYFLLFYEFLKIGLFAVGGGYATIPFLFHLTEIYNWFSKNQLIDMIAISNITPGPIGINMATYTGFTTKGFLGSVTTTAAIILGPFIITVITIYFINKFRESKFIKAVFNGLRPTSCALLTFVMIQLINQNIFTGGKFSIKAFFLTSILFILYPLFKKRPSFIILIGAMLGILFNIF